MQIAETTRRITEHDVASMLSTEWLHGKPREWDGLATGLEMQEKDREAVEEKQQEAASTLKGLRRGDHLVLDYCFRTHIYTYVGYSDFGQFDHGTQLKSDMSCHASVFSLFLLLLSKLSIPWSQPGSQTLLKFFRSSMAKTQTTKNDDAKRRHGREQAEELKRTLQSLQGERDDRAATLAEKERWIETYKSKEHSKDRPVGKRQGAKT